MKTTWQSPSFGNAVRLHCAGWILFVCCTLLCNAANSGQETVGSTNDNRIVLPANQYLTPAGTQVDLPGLRPQVIRLSPDGAILVASGKTHELIVADPASGRILQHVPLPGETAPDAVPVSTHILAPDKEGQVSYTGLIFSPDGTRIYLSNVNGSIKVFSVDANHVVSPIGSLSLPVSGLKTREADIPAGLAISPDGLRLYVALNLSNRLLEMELPSGKPLRLVNVGFAPYDVVLAKTNVYVSNWGGRIPDANSATGPAGKGTLVRVDPVRFIASEGSVSVIDLASGRVTKEILTGLHASAMALAPNGRHLAVANAASDTITVIDTSRDQIVENISMRWHPTDLFGASPNALVFDPRGATLYVCNGTQNAVAVVRFKPGHSKLSGLIPTGWFPGAIDYDASRKNLCVANIKGVGSGVPPKPGAPLKYNSHQYHGSLSIIPLPKSLALARFTHAVLANYQHARLKEAALPARAGQPPRPIPERLGEPSVFKHVVYIIKENRTYDQVLGDIPEGNGDASLCIFGEKFTPNQHRIARDFVLLDNTYCSGILSAEGHQWSDSAFSTDYMEKSYAGFPRSYPDGMEDNDVDALAYSPTGFIWDNVLAHGKTMRDYGEFTIGETRWNDPHNKKPITFTDYYRDFIDQTGLITISNRPAIASLAPHMAMNTIGWDMDVPDIFRAAQFIKDLKQFESTAKMPDFLLVCLPNDHTSGTRAGAPVPGAQVADNDLALGQIVEALSKSPFWKDTCIFVIEDDPQDGWDHVSGYRTTAYVISPYTRRHAVIHENYNQTSLIHSMELILGLPPMNQMDATATPMSACFTSTPDFTPFECLPANVPLDQLNPSPKKLSDRLQRRLAEASAKLDLREPDRCSEDTLNRILWHAQKGSLAAYPKWAITDKD
jgi:YVTN family beta-propeller protein